MTGRGKRFMAVLLGAAMILCGCQGRTERDQAGEQDLKKIRIGSVSYTHLDVYKRQEYNAKLMETYKDRIFYL